MAEFYEALPVEGSNFTGYSQGFKGDTSLGDALKGAGDVLGMAVQATDNYYQGTIKEQARDKTAQLLDDHGNDAAVDAVGGLDSSATPKEIQQGADRLALLKQAQANGTLKESSFWAQAELISRQLKMRYPGYWEHIDSSMSEQLGRKPALALQAQLQAEREAEASAADKERSDALKAARSAGLTDVFIAESKGKPMSTLEINTRVANRNNIEWSQQTEQRKFSLKKARGEATEEDASRALKSESTTSFVTMLNDGTDAFAIDMTEFNDAMDELQRQRASGKGIDPETQAQVSALKDQLMETIQNKKAQLTLKYSQDLPADKIKDSLGWIDTWAESITGLVGEGDVNVGRDNTALLKASKDADTFKFLMSEDAYRMASAAIGVIGPENYGAFVARNQDSAVVNETDLAMEKTMRDKTLFGKTTVQRAIEGLQTNGVTDPNVFRQYLKETADAATAPDMPPQQRKNAAVALYGEENANFIFGKVKNSERIEVFDMITAQKNLKNARKLFEDGEMDTSTYSMIMNRTRTIATQLMRDEGANLNEINTQRKTLDLTYDEKSNKLIAAPLGQYEPGSKTLVGKALEAWAESYGAKKSLESVAKVNHILGKIKYVTELNGENTNNVAKLMLAEAGIYIAPKEVEGGTGKTARAREPSAIEAIDKTVSTAIDNVFGGLDTIQEDLDNIPIEEKQAFRNKLIESLGRFNFLSPLEGADNEVITIDQPPVTGGNTEERKMTPLREERTL